MSDVYHDLLEFSQGARRVFVDNSGSERGKYYGWLSRILLMIGIDSLDILQDILESHMGTL